MTSTALVLASILIFWGLVSYFTKSTQYRKFATDTLFLSLIAGFTVARVSFVITFWEIYQKSWLTAFDIRDGGFNSYAGWLTGAMILFVRARGHRKLTTTYFKAALISAAIIFPLFTLNTLVGTQYNSSQIKVVNAKGDPRVLNLQTGKPLILNFWASWCPPCRREMPIFQNAQEKHKELEFIFINQQEAPKTAQHFLTENNIQLDNIYFDFSGSTAQQLGAYGLPTTLFFNHEGKLINSHMGGLSEASLQHYLKPFLVESTAN